jgi:hypothetical protein
MTRIARIAGEVAEELRDDSRRRHPGHSREGHGGDRPPAEQQRKGCAGEGVQCGIDETRGACRLQAVEQLGRGVLEAEQREQQDDADLGPGLQELVARVERHESTLAEGQSEYEVERDRRHADEEREAPEKAHAEKQRADFDEEQRGLVHSAA